jgi:ElaB/YqjD/DUF883 family membrane-anchored ribosome-binding protein
MDTASNTSQDVREAARETAKDVREGLRTAGAAASEASSNIQRDLQALREDLARLAEEISGIVSNKGNAAWRRARSSVDDAQTKGQEAVQEAVSAMREVSDNFIDALDQSLRSRPYTTLVIAAGLGFLLGATWRR